MFGQGSVSALTTEGGSWRDFRSQNYLLPMTTEHRNWAVVASAMEAQGATSSEMYRRAKAMADGQTDPKPTSFPAAPFSISAV